MDTRGTRSDGRTAEADRVRGIGRRAVWASAAAVLVAGAGGWIGLSDGSGPGAGRPTAQASPEAALRARLDLPWPEEGQASVAVEGVGSLGVSGGREPVPIASVAKVMTAYQILRDHPLRAGEDGPEITVDETAAQESHSLSESAAPVRQGQRLTQRKLLELLLLPSGNNVARLLARWDAGSEEAFVARMNRTAASLGMTRTRYTGASGLEATTRSTAEDQLTLARRAMEQPVLREVVAMRETTVPGHPGPLANTNRLLDEPGVIGLKTGSSTPAGGNLMWAAEVGSGAARHLVLGVVLGQRAHTSPAEGLRAALERSGRLVDALRRDLPSALAEVRS